VSDLAIQIREGGIASLVHHGRLYKREPGSDGRPHWSELIADRHRPVSDHRARRYERIYRHPKKIKPFRHYPRLPDLELGAPVFHTAFGYGTVTAIDGENITVTFGERKRQLRTRDLVTRTKAEASWYRYWLRGRKRRFEEGRRLAIFKSLCRFGEWQAFLDYYDFPRSTADDLIRRYKNEVAEAQPQLTGYRAIDVADPDRQVNERTPDSDANEREELVTRETAKRHERRPGHHTTLWSIRIKLPPDVLALCHKKYKKPNAKEFWRRAAYEFVGLDPDAPEDATEQETGHRRHGKKNHRDRKSR
jgi:hypothetical protein